MDNSATTQGCPIENIWKPEDYFFWMAVSGTQPFITLDLGNNKIDSILVKAYSSYSYKTLKISTGDKAKGNKWKLLFQDDDMANKMQDGGKYDLTQYDIGKYLKLEFFEFAMQMFSLASIVLYGDSEFLTKEIKQVTIEDIQSMKFKDQDLVQRYIDQLQKDCIAEITRHAMAVSQCAQDTTKGPLSEEWMKLKTLEKEASTKMLYI